MMRSKFGVFGLVLGGLLLLGAEAQAIPVTYTTTGVFGASGTNVFSSGGVTIRYEAPSITLPGPPPITLPDPQTVDANPTTNAGFGRFNTTGTTAMSPVTVSTSFTLTVTQLAVNMVPTPPPNNDIDFTSQITGTLQVNSSGAVLLFNPPLNQTITAGALPVIYQIVNAADQVAGRILIAPPSTGNGITAIEGRITVVPEPSAMVLVGMGAVAPIALMGRRRLKMRSAT